MARWGDICSEWSEEHFSTALVIFNRKPFFIWKILFSLSCITNISPWTWIYKELVIQISPKGMKQNNNKENNISLHKCAVTYQNQCLRSHLGPYFPDNYNHPLSIAIFNVVITHVEMHQINYLANLGREY